MPDPKGASSIFQPAGPSMTSEVGVADTFAAPTASGAAPGLTTSVRPATG